MGFRLICVFFLSAIVLAAQSAPTSLTSSTHDDNAASAVVVSAAEKPLIRTKRAEEILYGNHQNAPRVKKSDPDVAVTGGDNDNDDAKNQGAANKEGEKPQNPAAAATDGKENQIDTEDEQVPVYSQDETSSKSDSRSMEDVPVDADDNEYQRYEGQEGAEEAEALRKKRSIKSVMMTAENMADSRTSAISRPVRAKRDLDYDDLRRILEASREVPYEQEEEREEEVEVPERVYEMAPETSEEEEQMEEEEDGGPAALAMPYEYAPRYEGPSEKEELLRELVEKKVEEDAKEKLLDYLLAAALASESESTEGDEDDAAAADAEEEEMMEGPGREDYDVMSRNFVPAPMAIKRNEFYPYSYEPYGGRWGAMVPGTKRSSASDYERLYRLAEALNPDEEYEEKYVTF